jgi:hypothetical protein
MIMPEGGYMQAIWLLVITLCALVSVGMLSWRVRQESRRLAGALVRIEALNGTLAALCAGAVGVDRRLSRLEKQGRDLGYRQEAIENQQQGEQPYGEAIQLVQQGASAIRLVEELGLTRNEAELVVMLHGMKEAV